MSHDSVRSPPHSPLLAVLQRAPLSPRQRRAAGLSSPLTTATVSRNSRSHTSSSNPSPFASRTSSTCNSTSVRSMSAAASPLSATNAASGGPAHRVPPLPSFHSNSHQRAELCAPALRCIDIVGDAVLLPMSAASIDAVASATRPRTKRSQKRREQYDASPGRRDIHVCSSAAPRPFAQPQWFFDPTAGDSGGDGLYMDVHHNTHRQCVADAADEGVELGPRRLSTLSQQEASIVNAHGTHVNPNASDSDASSLPPASSFLSSRYSCTATHSAAASGEGGGGRKRSASPPFITCLSANTLLRDAPANLNNNNSTNTDTITAAAAVDAVTPRLCAPQIPSDAPLHLKPLRAAPPIRLADTYLCVRGPHAVLRSVTSQPSAALNADNRRDYEEAEGAVSPRTEALVTCRGMAAMRQNGSPQAGAAGGKANGRSTSVGTFFAPRSPTRRSVDEAANQLILLLTAAYCPRTDTMAYAPSAREQFGRLLLEVCDALLAATASPSQHVFTSSSASAPSPSNSSEAPPTPSAAQACRAEPPILRLASPLLVCGDLHGSFADALYFLHNATPFRCPKFLSIPLLFLGDYVDRGPHSVEVAALLLAYKALCPSRVLLLRGNHEDPEVNGDVFQYAEGSFLHKCLDLFGAEGRGSHGGGGPQVWARINAVFARLPVAAVIDDSIFACHGGIPRLRYQNDAFADAHSDAIPAELFNAMLSISIGGPSPHFPSSHAFWDAHAPVFETVMPVESDTPRTAVMRRLQRELLWNDPTPDSPSASVFRAGGTDDGGPTAIPRGDGHGFRPNIGRGDYEGIILEFGQTAIDAFLARYGWSLLLRAHQHKRGGLQLTNSAKVVTVFTSADYAGEPDAAGACLVDGGAVRLVAWDRAATQAFMIGKNAHALTNAPSPSLFCGRPSSADGAAPTLCVYSRHASPSPHDPFRSAACEGEDGQPMGGHFAFGAAYTATIDSHDILGGADSGGGHLLLPGGAAANSHISVHVTSTGGASAACIGSHRCAGFAYASAASSPSACPSGPFTLSSRHNRPWCSGMLPSDFLTVTEEDLLAWGPTRGSAVGSRRPSISSAPLTGGDLPAGAALPSLPSPPAAPTPEEEAAVSKAQSIIDLYMDGTTAPSQTAHRPVPLTDALEAPLHDASDVCSDEAHGIPNTPHFTPSSASARVRRRAGSEGAKQKSPLRLTAFMHSINAASGLLCGSYSGSNKSSPSHPTTLSSGSGGAASAVDQQPIGAAHAAANAVDGSRRPSIDLSPAAFLGCAQHVAGWGGGAALHSGPSLAERGDCGVNTEAPSPRRGGGVFVGTTLLNSTQTAVAADIHVQQSVTAPSDEAPLEGRARARGVSGASVQRERRVANVGVGADVAPFDSAAARALSMRRMRERVDALLATSSQVAPTNTGVPTPTPPLCDRPMSSPTRQASPPPAHNKPLPLRRTILSPTRSPMPRALAPLQPLGASPPGAPPAAPKGELPHVNVRTLSNAVSDALAVIPLSASPARRRAPISGGFVGTAPEGVSVNGEDSGHNTEGGVDESLSASRRSRSASASRKARNTKCG